MHAVRTFIVLLLALSMVAAMQSMAFCTEDIGYIVESPCYSPDGSRIVFASDVLTSDTAIMAVDSDGTDLTTLIHTSGVEYGSPVYHPKGRVIAFDRWVSGATPEYTVMRMDADGADPSALVKTGWGECEPCWLPDGARLVVTTFRDSSANLILVTSLGAMNSYVAAGTGAEGDAAVSPRGDYVVYDCFTVNEDDGREEYQCHIFKRRLGVSGASPVQLTSGSYNDCDPCYSPDGRRIAFTSDRAGGCDLYTMNADGSRMTRIPIPSGTAGDPAWSPDGRRIAFVRSAVDPLTRYITPDIWTIRPDGTGLARVTNLGPLFRVSGGSGEHRQTVAEAGR